MTQWEPTKRCEKRSDCLACEDRERYELLRQIVQRCRLAKPRIFAIVPLRKFGRPWLLAPHLHASPSRMIYEVDVALIEVPVDRGFGVIHRRIVTVLNYRARHTTENGFYHGKELSPYGKRLQEFSVATLERLFQHYRRKADIRQIGDVG